jgi:dTDP-4-dehydrorhamnose reductase
LSNYCKKNNIILIHFSTDYVFSGKKNFYEPSHKCNPVNYYGYTKYLGEKEIKKLNFKYYIFRISWLLSSSKFSFLKKIKKKLQSQKKIKVINDSISCPTTVIFINEFLKKNIDSFFTENNKGTYHLVNPVCLSFYQLAKIIEKIIYKRSTNLIDKIEFKNYNLIAKRPKISKLSIKKTRENFKIPKNFLLNDIKKLLNEKN